MIQQPRDASGREIKEGDIIAVGQRSGNTGSIVLREVIGFQGEISFYDYAARAYVPQAKIKTRFLTFSSPGMLVRGRVGGLIERSDNCLVIPQGVHWTVLDDAPQEDE